MITGELIFWVCIVIMWIVITVHYMRAKKPIQTALKGMFTGIGSLLLLYFVGDKIGLFLPVNLFTCVIAMIFGAPGVIALALLDKFLL